MDSSRQQLRSKTFQNIHQVRYLNNSSLYYCLSIGILEVFARIKEICKDTQKKSLLGIILTNIIKTLTKDPLSNFFSLNLIEILNSNLGLSETFELLQQLQENQNYCEALSESFRELLYEKIDNPNKPLKEVISSGNVSEDNFDSIFRVVANTFGLHIAVFTNKHVNYKPARAVNSPKLIILYNEGDYSLGYNESMQRYDENIQRDNSVIKGIIDIKVGRLDPSE